MNNGVDRYFISNPRNNSELVRQPLTIAMSYGKDPSYKNIGVVRTNASDDIVPDTRGKYFPSRNAIRALVDQA